MQWPSQWHHPAKRLGFEMQLNLSCDQTVYAPQSCGICLMFHAYYNMYMCGCAGAAVQQASSFRVISLRFLSPLGQDYALHRATPGVLIFLSTRDDMYHWQELNMLQRQCARFVPCSATIAFLDLHLPHSLPCCNMAMVLGYNCKMFVEPK